MPGGAHRQPGRTARGERGDAPAPCGGGGGGAAGGPPPSPPPREHPPPPVALSRPALLCAGRRRGEHRRLLRRLLLLSSRDRKGALLRAELTRALVALAGELSVERGLVGLSGCAPAATGSDSVSGQLKPALRLR